MRKILILIALTLCIVSLEGASSRCNKRHKCPPKQNFPRGNSDNLEQESSEIDHRRIKMKEISEFDQIESDENSESQLASENVNDDNERYYRIKRIPLRLKPLPKRR